MARTRDDLIRQIHPEGGTYLHAVPLSDPMAHHNLSLGARLLSAGYSIVVDDGLWSSSARLAEVSLEDLATNPPAAVLSPLAAYRIAAAAVIRTGGHLQVGVSDPRPFTPRAEAAILKAGDVELACERVRRRVSADAASRLTSLFVVDDTPDGRRHVDSIFRGDGDRFVVKVRIPAAIRVDRCDTTWYDRYFLEGNDEYLENYWLGRPFDATRPTWEYLVEGVLEVVSEKALRKIDRTGGWPDLSAARSNRLGAGGR